MENLFGNPFHPKKDVVPKPTVEVLSLFGYPKWCTHYHCNSFIIFTFQFTYQPSQYCILMDEMLGTKTRPWRELNFPIKPQQVKSWLSLVINMMLPWLWSCEYIWSLWEKVQHPHDEMTLLRCFLYLKCQEKNWSCPNYLRTVLSKQEYLEFSGMVLSLFNLYASYDEISRNIYYCILKYIQKIVDNKDTLIPMTSRI